MEFKLEKLLTGRKSPCCWKTKAPRGGWRRHSFVCQDHLGREFESKKKRADAYGLNHTTVDFRLKSGWTLEEALTIPRIDHHECYKGHRK